MHVKVRVKANARRETFEVISPASFKISVREKAQGDMANHRVIALVARHVGLPVKSVRIVTGHHAPSKTLVVRYFSKK